MLYQYLLKPLLFRFEAERVHYIVMFLLKLSLRLPFAKAWATWYFQVKNPVLATHIAGLSFENPIGLAAGFDKNAEWIDELACLGFGFIEIGTLTPRPQEGNPKPRLFRLPQDEAIINRMGFNNVGVEQAIRNLRKRKSKIIVGGNIGKNKNTPNEQATQDYVYAFEQLFNYVDYFVVNVSSPNTPNLRALQEREPLQHLLQTLQTLNQQKPQAKPIFLKIAPDLDFAQVAEVIDIVTQTQITGIIATNTTIDRQGLQTPTDKITQIGAGGLSGKPLNQRAAEIIRFIRKNAPKELIIIGVGGIFTPQDALQKLEAGANLVQIYTGFIYQGAGIVKKINRFLAQYLDKKVNSVLKK